MDIAATQLSTYNNFEGLASLRAQAKNDQDKAVDKVAEQFEGMFIHMMLKEMRKTVPESVFFDSPSMKLYQDMQDQQVALDLAKEGPLGLASILKANVAQQKGSSDAGSEKVAFSLNKPLDRGFTLNNKVKNYDVPRQQSSGRALDAYHQVNQVR